MFDPCMSADDIDVFKKFLNTQEKKLKRSITRDLIQDEKHAVIRTGCQQLDHVTGIGGLPRGKIVEVYGPESSGKCVGPDAMIPMPGLGLIRMRELAAQHGLWDREPEYVADCDYKILATEGDADASHLYYAGPCETRRIHTLYGHETRSTPTHRTLHLQPSGIARWVAASDARPGQILLTMTGGEVCTPGQKIRPELTSDAIPLGLDEAGARFFGVLAGLEPRGGDAWSLSLTDLAILKRIRQWCREFGYSDVFTVENTWTRVTGMARLAEHAYPWGRSAFHEHTLLSLRQSDLRYQRAWLVGVAAARARWSHSDLEMEFYSREVGDTVRAVAENLGIACVRYEIPNTGGDVLVKLAVRNRLSQERLFGLDAWGEGGVPGSWRALRVPDEEPNHPFAGQTLRAARTLLESMGEVPGFDPEDASKENCDRVWRTLQPHELKRAQARKLLQTLVLLADPKVSWDRITGTSDGGEAPCTDFRVPIGHYYAADGLVNHNSTALYSVANHELRNRKDSVVVLMDFEKSLTGDYAEKLGLAEHMDEGRFMCLTPSTIEDADAIVDYFREKHMAPSMLIVDSVASMLPQEFLTEGVEEGRIGTQARMLAKLFSKWSDYASLSGTSIVCLNQLRNKLDFNKFSPTLFIPGAAGAENEMTPGGRAFRHYCAMRIRVEADKVVNKLVINPMLSRKDQKPDKVPVGVRVKANTIKNKMASPYKKAHFYIRFGWGIDNVFLMMDQALEQEVFTVSGNGNYSLEIAGGEVVSCRGKDNLEPWIRGNAAIQQALVKALQWGEVDALTEKAVAYETEDFAEETVTQSGSFGGRKAEGLVAGARELGLVTEDAKGRLELKIGNLTFTGKDIADLERSLGRPDRAALEKMMGGRAGISGEEIGEVFGEEE